MSLIIDELFARAVKGGSDSQPSRNVLLNQHIAHRAGIYLNAVHEAGEPFRPFESIFDTAHARALFMIPPWLFRCASEFMSSSSIVDMLETLYSGRGPLAVRDYLSPRIIGDPGMMSRLAKLDPAFLEAPTTAPQRPYAVPAS